MKGLGGGGGGICLYGEFWIPICDTGLGGIYLYYRSLNNIDRVRCINAVSLYKYKTNPWNIIYHFFVSGLNQSSHSQSIAEINNNNIITFILFAFFFICLSRKIQTPPGPYTFYSIHYLRQSSLEVNCRIWRKKILTFVNF